MSTDAIRAVDVLNATCRTLGLDIVEFRSSARGAPIRRARQVAAYLMREAVHPPVPFDTIARHIGRTRSTAIHAHRKVEEVLLGLKVERELLSNVHAVRRALGGKKA